MKTPFAIGFDYRLKSGFGKLRQMVGLHTGHAVLAL